ncbi:MAG: leucine-rich repeat domain-containing protein [Faecalibacterium sp.]|nr:leucine-rich repeat domain-containing protein [Ruminococcus sp.]MCM1393057.1 leucine-rich repeat domain-containing protein [Ruminococcus sp.]MCM1485683.1 leucine-rich repeat domain-containing protein [Faecalibacterium sp.]
MKQTAKKILSCVLAVLMLVCAVPMAASAAEVSSGQCGDNVYWSLDDQGTLTISGSGDMWEPERYPNWDDGETPQLFSGWSVSKVVIEKGITSIWSSAFTRCVNLTSIVVDDNNEDYSSEDGVLFNKSKTTLIQYPNSDLRTTYTIPKSVTNIAPRAFKNCSNLINIVLPDGMTNIDMYAFEDCSNLSSIVIPENVTSIDYGVFKGCSKLISVEMPDSIEIIENGAFEDCSSLSNVVISNGVISIGRHSFRGCSSLKSIAIPDGVTDLGDSAFEECSELENITIGSGISRIENHTFKGCSSLKSIIIPDNVRNMEVDAFDECANLESIKIGSGLGISGEGALFYGCKSLKYIDVDPDNRYFSSSINGVLFNKNKTQIMRYFEGNESNEYIIPDEVASLYYGAFWNCENLRSITIPDSVTYIGCCAFYNCSNLNDIVISNSVTCIDESAFYNCEKLSDVYYTGSQDEWNEIDICWANDSLTDATIHYENETEDEISGQCGDNVYWTLDDEGLLQISGAGAMYDYYQEDNNLSSPFSDLDIKKIEINNGITYIGHQTFNMSWYWTEYVSIPESVEEIAEDAFDTGIKEYLVNSANKYYSSDEYGVLFDKNKTKLLNYPITNERTSYDIPNTVLDINNRAFSGAWYLEDVTIPNSITNIGIGTFSGCSFNNITIPDSVVSIGEYAFGSCDVLANVNIGSGVESIENMAFAGCQKLKNVKVPNNVKSIGDYAFGYMSKGDGEDEDLKYENFTIYGEKNTAAEKYAQENNFIFVDINPTPTTLTDTATGIELTYDQNVLSKNVSLVVEPIADSVGSAALKDNYKFVSSYDISLEKDGVKTQPNGKVTVKMPLPDGYNADTTAVYYVSADGKAERLESTYDDGCVVFETDHFSEYVLVDESTQYGIYQPAECTHICHKGGFVGFIYKIVRLFWKLFGINKTCACGIEHY